MPLNVKNMISVEDLVLQATPFTEYGRVWPARLLKTYACIRPYQITIIGYSNLQTLLIGLGRIWEMTLPRYVLSEVSVVEGNNATLATYIRVCLVHLSVLHECPTNSYMYKKLRGIKWG